jgi:ERCC4-related helicase
VKPGDWLRSRSLRGVVQIVDIAEAFGTTTVRVWHPASQRVAVVSATDLEPSPAEPADLNAVIAAVAGARIADALAGGALIAPTQSLVEPLPHQLRALSRAIASEPIRMLFADEVGLGKTIEAGLVIAELMFRGLARRILIVAPKGLVPQWQTELARRFGEDFVAVASAEVGALAGRREDNFWLSFDRLIVPLDAVKPIEARRGWSDERLERYNSARSTNLAAAGWDVVVIDEAHRVGASTEQVARHRLARMLVDAIPNVLLLTATPHAGHSNGFRRVLSLLDQREFEGDAPLNPARIRPYVVRTSKRVAIDGSGKPLFQPRSTTKVVLDWPVDRPRQRELYDEVTGYVREGYDLGRREKNNSLVFLMLLMQRLVSSSTRAIETALDRRLLSLRSVENRADAATERSVQLRLDDDFWETDPNEQLDALLQAQLPAMRNERATVERLLGIASDAQAEGLDAKLERLYRLLVELAQEENDPLVKVLVFTEFLPTQQVIVEFLESMGVSIATLNGGMAVEEREAAQLAFEAEARVLVSTEAGGEGLNLQVAHLVVNFDIPWNPMRIEQRIGRVDRIGQTHPVRAFNLVLRDSVEDRVHEVLERKLAQILEEFGVDKLSDVLDSSGFEGAFQTAYAEVIGGRDIDEVTSDVATDVAESGTLLRDWRDLLGGEMPDPAEARAMREHPLPAWVERMTVAGINAAGGSVQRQTLGWILEWPDGRTLEASFRRSEAGSDRRLLTLGDERVAAILGSSTSRVADGPIPKVAIGDGMAGVWSLWLIVAHAGPREKLRALPILHDPGGEVRMPSAYAIWDRLLEDEAQVEVRGVMADADAAAARAHARAEAEAQGRVVYEDLREGLITQLRTRRERYLDYVERRRQLIERVGLENVRRRRLAELDREKERELALMPVIDVAPELRCVAMLELVS